MLFENKNRLLNRDIVLREIWGEEGYFTTRSMDVFITKLRKYLSDDPKIEIRNIHGTGYILEVKEPNK
jgi:DNA-binding response OmpR family regulator